MLNQSVQEPIEAAKQIENMKLGDMVMLAQSALSNLEEPEKIGIAHAKLGMFAEQAEKIQGDAEATHELLELRENAIFAQKCITKKYFDTAKLEIAELIQKSKQLNSLI